MTDFSGQLRKVIMPYKRIAYSVNVMRPSACLVINPIMVDSFAALFYCARPKTVHLSLLGTKLFVGYKVHRGSTNVFLLLQISSGIV